MSLIRLSQRTVIGVDPSLTRTGVAVWREGAVRTFSIATTPADGPRVVRERIICGQIMPYVESGQTVAVVEAVHLSKFTGRSALDLAGLHDVLVYGFHARGVTTGVAVPQGPKTMATGKGNASKPQMVASAESELGFSVATPDEADAAWLMAMGVVAGGGTINGWPSLETKARWLREKTLESRAAALNKITWIGSFEPDWLRLEDKN